MAVCLLTVVSTTASAHIILTSHDSRYGRREIKQGPCGRRGGMRSENVYTYAPGQTIVLVWDEFIPHPGHFRIAFDADGDDDFVDPADYDDFLTNEAVLLDNLFPHDRGGAMSDWTQEVTLPDIECDNCTLQLTQMMTDKPPYEIGTNDLYYNCIDLVLRRGAGPDAGAPVMDLGMPQPMDDAMVPNPPDGGGNGDGGTPPVVDAGPSTDGSQGPDPGQGTDAGPPSRTDSGGDAQPAGSGSTSKDSGGCTTSPSSPSDVDILWILPCLILGLRRRRKDFKLA